MKAHLPLLGAFRRFVSPSAKELAELVAWGLLALVALSLAMLPHDQTAAAIEWLFRWLEAEP